MNYNSDMAPRPDEGPAREPTYAPPGGGPTDVENMPDDDFEPTHRATGGAPEPEEEDPFPWDEPIIPEVESGPNSPEPAPAQPLEDEAIPGAEEITYAPVRQRTIAQARYRIPYVARLDVSPQAPESTPTESRLAKR